MGQVRQAPKHPDPLTNLYAFFGLSGVLPVTFPVAVLLFVSLVLLPSLLCLLLGSGVHNYICDCPCSLTQVSSIIGAHARCPHSQAPPA